MNLIYRSNISFGPKDPNVEDNTVVYNFFRSIKATIARLRPKKVFCALEGKSNFRYGLFSEYKANRIIKRAKEEKEQTFNRQRDKVIELLSLLPITIVSADGFEADDVISTLAHNLKDEEVIVVSADTDFLQLLQCDIGVKLYNPSNNPSKQSSITFSSPPIHHYVGWKSLRGDKADNIPGIVSDKKATELMEDPELLRTFLADEQNSEKFNLNKSLIQLAEIPDGGISFTEGTSDLPKLRSIFQDLQLPTMIADKYWLAFEETFRELTQ